MVESREAVRSKVSGRVRLIAAALVMVIEDAEPIVDVDRRVLIGGLARGHSSRLCRLWRHLLTRLLGHSADCDVASNGWLRASNFILLRFEL